MNILKGKKEIICLFLIVSYFLNKLSWYFWKKILDALESSSYPKNMKRENVNEGRRPVS